MRFNLIAAFGIAAATLAGCVAPVPMTGPAVPTAPGVAPELLRGLLEAAHQAPSVGLTQPWRWMRCWVNRNAGIRWWRSATLPGASSNVSTPVAVAGAVMASPRG